jgi:putative hydrolase of the HAD superfamily
MIKNILSDMGGVVFLQDTQEAFRRFRSYGLDPDFYMGAYGQKDFFLDVETGKIDADEFCRRMAEATGRDHISWDEAQYCWLGFLKSVPVNRLHFLSKLKANYHLCLLTNTNPFIMGFTRSNRFSDDGRPISDYFDSLFCSYEIKRYKPNPDFFEYALEADGMKADECIFLDDSLKNVQGAEALGIHGFHVAPDEDWTTRLAETLSRLNA